MEVNPYAVVAGEVMDNRKKFFRIICGFKNEASSFKKFHSGELVRIICSQLAAMRNQKRHSHRKGEKQRDRVRLSHLRRTGG